ncbi:MAG: ABC transporter substrate-binding protein [Burkholderiales bacterium]|nr:ABC transporter substrate-binding protein [Burkholderiales bacterium]
MSSPSPSRRRLLRGAAAGAALAAAAPLRAQAEPIRIGVPTALNDPDGRDTVDAVQMAVSELNAQGGLLGRLLEVKVGDETHDPATGAAVIEALTDDGRADVLIGGHTSGVTLAQLERVAAARKVFLSCGGASPAITQHVLKDYARFKYVFRVHPVNAAHQARALVEFIAGFLVDEMRYNRIALVGEDDNWVRNLLPVLARNASAVGAEVRLTEIVDRSTSDFTPLLSKIQASGAHFALTLFARIASERFVRQWAGSGVAALIGGIDARASRPDFYAAAQGDARGQIVAGFALRAPITARTVPFWDAFVARTGRPGPAHAAMGAYDAVHLYADAVRRAGTVEADALVEALKSTDHVGVTGRIQFDEGHDVKAGPGLANLLFWQWQDNGERVVLWPRELRSGKPFVPPLRRRP